MDVREAILSRIETILDGITDIQTVERNRIAFDETQLPAAGVLEGDEEVAPTNLGRAAAASGRPYIVTATPQVFVKVGEPSEEIGPALSEPIGDYIERINPSAVGTSCAFHWGRRYILFAPLDGQLFWFVDGGHSADRHKLPGALQSPTVGGTGVFDRQRPDPTAGDPADPPGHYSEPRHFYIRHQYPHALFSDLFLPQISGSLLWFRYASGRHYLGCKLSLE